MHIAFANRRRAPRVSTALDAVMAIEEPRLVADCAIVDVNAYGAKVRTSLSTLPDRFHVIDVLSSIAYAAKVVWRQGNELGLRFEQTIALKSGLAPEWLCEVQAVRIAADAAERSADLMSEVPFDEALPQILTA